jgi:DNA-binding CsgD family transcriptional regulator
MSTRGRPRHPDVLTPRQQEVLEYVREGMTNEQIARRMGISPDGVKFHVSEILSRTGARHRRDAAEWSRERERPSAVLRGWRTRGVRRFSHGCRLHDALPGVREERVAC